jgi:hypothetical protein
MNGLKIDWALLRSQKLTLLQVIMTSPPTVAEDLTGILHLIDHIQNEAAANSEIGIKEVFGDD